MKLDWPTRILVWCVATIVHGQELDLAGPAAALEGQHGLAKGLEMDYGPFVSYTINCRNRASNSTDNLAIKGIAIKLGSTNAATVCFDTDLVRFAAGWTGGFLDINTTHLASYKGTTEAFVAGKIQFSAPVVPGWTSGNNFADPRPLRNGPLPRELAKYRGLYRWGDRVVLSYTVSGVGVLDMPGFESRGGLGAFTRTIQLGPSTKALKLMACSSSWPVSRRVGDPRLRWMIWSGDGPTDKPNPSLPLPGGDLAPSLLSSPPQTEERTERAAGLTGAPVGTKLESTNGLWTVEIPPLKARATFKLILVTGARNDGLQTNLESLLAHTTIEDPETFCRGGPPRWAEPVETKGRLGSGTGAYVVDTLTVPEVNPWKSWLRFTAFDFFDDGRAAIGTWNGDVWMVSGIDRDLGKLTWKRFATGIYEPLGLKVVKGGPTEAGHTRSGKVRPHPDPLPQERENRSAAVDPAEVFGLFAGWETRTHPRNDIEFSQKPEFSPSLPQSGGEGWGEEGRSNRPQRSSQGEGEVQGGDARGLNSTAAHPGPATAEIEEIRSRIIIKSQNSGHTAGSFPLTPSLSPDGGEGVRRTGEGTGFKENSTARQEPRPTFREVIYVLGRDQITRLHDLNGDGEADFYENFNNDAFVAPNYHAFAFDLQADAHGNFYYARTGHRADPALPMNGCLVEVPSDGARTEVVATGFRAPNGLSIGPHDEITCSDNQGNWVPASRINLVKRGGFYGYVPHAHLPVAPTDYEKPICWLPMPIDNSSGGQAWVKGRRWGPFEGKLLHTSYGKSALFLVLMEEVNGQVQGGVVQFPLRFDSGIMRARFGPVDGQLYVAGLKGWQTTGARDAAFQRVRFTGKAVHMPQELRVRKNGIELTFTEPLDPMSAADEQNYAIEQWNYRWTEQYGSPDYSVADPQKNGRDPVPVQSVRVSSDARTVFLGISDLQPVMQMRIQLRLRSMDGSRIAQEIYQTINRVPDQE
jgi:hypothetical protein